MTKEAGWPERRRGHAAGALGSDRSPLTAAHQRSPWPLGVRPGPGCRGAARRGASLPAPPAGRRRGSAAVQGLRAGPVLRPAAAPRRAKPGGPSWCPCVLTRGRSQGEGHVRCLGGQTPSWSRSLGAVRPPAQVATVTPRAAPTATPSLPRSSGALACVLGTPRRSGARSQQRRFAKGVVGTGIGRFCLPPRRCLRLLSACRAFLPSLSEGVLLDVEF